MRAAQELLDAVHGLAQLEAFEPERYRARLAEVLDGEPATLDALDAADDTLRGALSAIDTFSARCMRIRLDHALAGDTSVATPLRKVLAGTVTSYVGDLGLLGERVRAVAARVDPAGADDTADRVVAAARVVLADRAALHDHVLDVARQLANARIDAARAQARDRHNEETLRRRWTAALRELEQVAARPARIAEAPWRDRVATFLGPDEPIEEPPELSLGELIEPY